MANPLSFFTRNRPAGQPPRQSQFQRMPGPQGADAQEQSSVYSGFYGEMPVPATQFATSTARLHDLEVVPSVRTVASNASVVDRRWRRNGLDYTAGRQSRHERLPQQYDPVISSRFQNWLIGPQVNYILNADWYIAYPAATVMLGGQHNLAWSNKVDQLSTRTTGGPGPGAMLPAPRFKSVQTVPRYSTMPSMYNTQSQPT